MEEDAGDEGCWELAALGGLHLTSLLVEAFRHCCWGLAACGRVLLLLRLFGLALLWHGCLRVLGGRESGRNSHRALLFVAVVFADGGANKNVFLLWCSCNCRNDKTNDTVSQSCDNRSTVVTIDVILTSFYSESDFLSYFIFVCPVVVCVELLSDWLRDLARTQWFVHPPSSYISSTRRTVTLFRAI